MANGISPTGAAQPIATLEQLPADPVAIAKQLIADNRSARSGINYGELLRDIDQQISNNPALGAEVEAAIKLELGPAGTTKLMTASYNLGTGDKALRISRDAPTITEYFNGTAHIKLGKAATGRYIYTAADDKAHYARLDKMFGDGNAKTFDGPAIQTGINDMLKRGFRLDQQAEYKAVLAAEAKAAAEAAEGSGINATMVTDLLQMTLDLAGIVDPTGIADGSNAVISLGRGISNAFSGEWKAAGGNLVDGLISAAGIVPYLGDVAKAGKIGNWAKTVANAIELAAKNPAMAKKLEPVLREISDLVNKIPQGMIDALPADAKAALTKMKGQLDEMFGAAAKKVDDVLLSRARKILGDLPLNTGSLDELYKAGKLSMDEARVLAKDAGWKSTDGKWIYPPNNGFEGAITQAALKPPSKIDRYGGWVDQKGKFNDTGNFFSPAGSSYGSRALPPGTDTRPFTKYEVVKPFDVSSGRATSWFGESGGGMQHMSTIETDILIKRGFIRKID
ncbi:MAG: TNT domain-containing protein [Sphingomonadales bacterium]|nr:TNT domain-containing protein [Sphingomonadales bacterium]